MIRLKPDKGITVTEAKAGNVPLIILKPQTPKTGVPGILWLHGGGYITGMKEMVFIMLI